MTQPTPPMLRRAGFSLMELLLAVTVLTFVTGATYALFRSQSQNFKNNTARYDLIENARGAIEAADMVATSLNQLSEEILQDALSSVHAEIEGDAEAA